MGSSIGNALEDSREWIGQKEGNDKLHYGDVNRFGFCALALGDQRSSTDAPVKEDPYSNAEEPLARGLFDAGGSLTYVNVGQHVAQRQLNQPIPVRLRSPLC